MSNLTVQKKTSRAKTKAKSTMEEVPCPTLMPPVPISAKGGSNNNTILTYSNGIQETRSGGSRAWRNNNPGNIRPGYLTGEIGSAGGFAVFSSEAMGQAGIVENLQRPQYSQLTVFGAVSKWAPPSDGNSTAVYQARVQKATGIDGQTLISSLNQSQLEAVANAIRNEEGWIVGKRTCSVQKTQ